MYVELNACSAFSFLEGASLPEDLAATAADLGYPAMALCDRAGIYGAPRFFSACRKLGVKALVGAQVPLDNGQRITLLAESRAGYQNLCRLLTRVHLRSAKSEGRASWEDIGQYRAGLVALIHHLPDADRIHVIFGRRNCYVELSRHAMRDQEQDNRDKAHWAKARRVPLIASNQVRYARPNARALADVFAALRHKTKLDQAGRLLEVNSERHLKSPREMAALFADLPEAIGNTRDLADRLDFTLEDLGYEFPRYPLPLGETPSSYLRKLTWQHASERYRPLHDKAKRQIEHELKVIDKLELAGYFLIVWDIVEFCRREKILAQGRGSAANSAVCYSLGITAVDPVGMELLFERFLSEERGEWPDIDIDLPSGDQRERVIQYVYERYGKRGAAMTANVITYRSRSAAREVGKVLGFPEELIGRLAKLLPHFEYTDDADLITSQARNAGFDTDHPRVQKLLHLSREIQNLPRHLGQHSGGMVICQGELDSVVPLENASMPGRVVVQWDKDDCADLGIIKVDLLGLGMMAAIEKSIEIIHSRGGDLDLAHLPPDDPETYGMIQNADTVGVFQIESRAQMATLPRMRPRTFYDLVVEVAIIRPGPIVGNMVHPYLNRRLGREPVTYPHPSLEPVLKRTLGVPLFQEQLLRLAMVAANFTGGEAEELRRAMGFKRSVERMRAIEQRLRKGLSTNGITGEGAEQIIKSITSFALYGFPESHAASFALIAYASSYLKAHYPEVFTTALLNYQPMGFYSPAVLVKDAQRHGVRVRPIDVQHSLVKCHVEDGRCFRLGLRYVSGMRTEAAQSIVAARENGPFRSIDDFADRTACRKTELETLAELGALNSLGEKTHRRDALWQIEKAWRPKEPLFSECSDDDPSPLDPMTTGERLEADYRASGLTTGPHPMHYLRPQLCQQRILAAIDLEKATRNQRVRVAGAVVVRQRPGTAKGFVFLTLEDETGISNVIITPDRFQENRIVVTTAPFVLVEGLLQRQDGVISVKAETIQALPGGEIPLRSHDFH